MRPRICLSMIVKNEAPVITRCLASVRPFIDHWVIVDTGSTDGTQDIVRRFMHDLPGTLHERPWKNFAHNRNEALELARPHADYLLFIDADEQLRMPAQYRWPALDADGYLFLCDMNGWEYQRNSMVATRVDWRWEGVLHEYLAAPAHGPWQTLAGPVIEVAHDGARGRDPDTYLRDIAVLEQDLREHPDNTRNVFYLAQSYRDAGRLQDSLEWYRRRAGMGGWEEESWYALFQVAVLTERLQMPDSAVRDAYLAAYAQRPQRAEPLCELARYHRLRSEFALAHLYAQQAARIPRPADILFVDGAVYAWRALDELAVSSFYAPGAQDQGRDALRQLLRDQRFPASETARMQANRTFYGL
ncbi:glycosyltransferase [Acidovorax sp. BLS4]|uniref:tetratricopeptide repeat-containing glycosyltransferase n=1 Tax=Acidovorax sp. BLS4 TaxID=3273430 RepID=UPI002942A054|nr:glycosyltransferase [Paracidovorax avenae]WOI47614.1 glycosyltransferase [Paracidovorax avenae]